MNIQKFEFDAVMICFERLNLGPVETGPKLSRKAACTIQLGLLTYYLLAATNKNILLFCMYSCCSEPIAK